jgi:hypothetical protein
LDAGKIHTKKIYLSLAAFENIFRPQAASNHLESHRDLFLDAATSSLKRVTEMIFRIVGVFIKTSQTSDTV